MNIDKINHYPPLDLPCTDVVFIQIMLIQNAIQSPPMDAMSEERKVLRIRNNRNSLEVDQVAEGVSNVLASVSMRKGMLTEESARVSRSNSQ